MKDERLKNAVKIEDSKIRKRNGHGPRFTYWEIGGIVDIRGIRRFTENNIYFPYIPYFP